MTRPAHFCVLDASWTAKGGAHGQFEFTLTNLSDHDLTGFRLGYTSVTLNLDPEKIANARRVRLEGSCHELVPPETLILRSGETWNFAVGGLMRKPHHFNDGATSAYLVLSDGSVHGVCCSDLTLKDEIPLPPEPDMPEGRIEIPVGILPWPNACRAEDFAVPPPVLYPSPDTCPDAPKAMAGVEELAQRLIPAAPAPFAFAPASAGIAVVFARNADLAEEGYELHFGPTELTLFFAAERGRWYGLITLAQMMHAAHRYPNHYAFPRAGTIVDAPRHGWRGCHVDVSRQMLPVESVRRLIDILAWHKMNVLHWHLTDDEGWRIEIKALPELQQIASRRGPGERLSAQLGGGAETIAGYYSQDEVADLVKHTADMFVAIMPEIDVPGHCAALLAACPYLRDPDEPDESYVSGQGFPNNALNPAMEETYAVLTTVFKEVAGLFPFPYLHIGGDEVAAKAWHQSPRALALMRTEGLSGTPELQAHLLRCVQKILAGLGKRLASWNEVAQGGGVARDGTLLIAWERVADGPARAGEGYDVVMSPGEAYYLDMARSDGFLAPGHHWAGTVPPEKTYRFETSPHFAADVVSRLMGVQACIWTENLALRDRFNHLVFPRLSAVAEAAWTQAGNKDWQRFCAQSRFMPQL